MHFLVAERMEQFRADVDLLLPAGKLHLDGFFHLVYHKIQVVLPLEGPQRVLQCPDALLMQLPDIELDGEFFGIGVHHVLQEQYLVVLKAGVAFLPGFPVYPAFAHKDLQVDKRVDGQEMPEFQVFFPKDLELKGVGIILQGKDRPALAVLGNPVLHVGDYPRQAEFPVQVGRQVVEGIDLRIAEGLDSPS